MKTKRSNKMKTLKLRILSIALVLAFTLIPVGSAFAATTADVTVTATPTYIALTNSEATWSIGAVAESATVYWTSAGTAPAEPLVAGDMKSTITNTGSVAEDISVHAHNFTGGVGWTLHGTTVNSNVVVLSAGATGDANIAAMRHLVDTTPQNLATDLAAAGTIKWCMELRTGTFTDGVAKSATVTLTASQHV
jgi:hypothetical protein